MALVDILLHGYSVFFLESPVNPSRICSSVYKMNQDDSKMKRGIDSGYNRCVCSLIWINFNFPFVDDPRVGILMFLNWKLRFFLWLTFVPLLFSEGIRKKMNRSFFFKFVIPLLDAGINYEATSIVCVSIWITQLFVF